MTNRRDGISSGSSFQRQSSHSQGRISINDLTPAAHKELYLTKDQHTELLELIDRSVSDRLSDDAETQVVSIPLLSSVHGALELIATGQRTDINGLLSNLIRDMLSQYTIKNG